MSLTCTFVIVDAPSSFSPFVEFKEKTQQWKLLGEYLAFFYDGYYSKGFFLQDFTFRLAEAWRETQSELLIPWLGIFFSFN